MQAVRVVMYIVGCALLALAVRSVAAAFAAGTSSGRGLDALDHNAWIQVGIAGIYLLLFAATLTSLAQAREAAKDGTEATKLALEAAGKSAEAHGKSAASFAVIASKQQSLVEAAESSAREASAAARAAEDALAAPRREARTTILATWPSIRGALRSNLRPQSGFRGQAKGVMEWRANVELARTLFTALVPHACRLGLEDAKDTLKSEYYIESALRSIPAGPVHGHGESECSTCKHVADCVDVVLATMESATQRLQSEGDA